jgi:hypothetical protein
VFNDANSDLTFDDGDSGVGGATLKLRTSDLGLVATTTSSGSGAYSFSGIASGNYLLFLTVPGGYVMEDSVPSVIGVYVAPGSVVMVNFPLVVPP